MPRAGTRRSPKNRCKCIKKDGLRCKNTQVSNGKCRTHINFPNSCFRSKSDAKKKVPFVAAPSIAAPNVVVSASQNIGSPAVAAAGPPPVSQATSQDDTDGNINAPFNLERKLNVDAKYLGTGLAYKDFYIFDPPGDPYGKVIRSKVRSFNSPTDEYFPGLTHDDPGYPAIKRISDDRAVIYIGKGLGRLNRQVVSVGRTFLSDQFGTRNPGTPLEKFFRFRIEGFKHSNNVFSGILAKRWSESEQAYVGSASNTFLGLIRKSYTFTPDMFSSMRFDDGL